MTSSAAYRHQDVQVVAVLGPAVGPHGQRGHGQPDRPDKVVVGHELDLRLRRVFKDRFQPLFRIVLAYKNWFADLSRHVSVSQQQHLTYTDLARNNSVSTS